MQLIQHKNEIKWLLQTATTFQKNEMLKEDGDIISFWSALKEMETRSQIKSPASDRRVITIIGEPMVVFQATDLFAKPPEEGLVRLTAEKKQMNQLPSFVNSNRILDWVDILYVSPKAVKQHQESIGKSHLFVKDKLPIWSRNLFQQNKVSSVFSETDINPPTAFSSIPFYESSQFSYEYLFDEYVTKPKRINTIERIPVSLPKDILTRFSNGWHDAEERKTLIDEATARMINTYWLQNNPAVDQWIPLLLIQIKEIITIRELQAEPDVFIEKLKRWGERLTHVT